jgi:drug/metabolite transporter (DMT)-like permease
VTTDATAPPHADRPFFAIVLMVLGVASLAAMDAVGKSAVLVLPVAQVMFLRAIVTTSLLLPFVAAQGGLGAIRTAQPRNQLLRVLLSCVSTLAFFYALRHLPLATAISIAFVAPLFMTALSVPMLGERVGWHRWGAIVVGLVGVLVITRPGMGDVPWLPALMSLVAAVFYAGSMVLSRKLTRTDGDLALLFYNNFGQLFFMGAITLFVWRDFGWSEIGLVVGMALLMLAGQWFLVRAFRFGAVGLLAPFHYIELPLAAIIGWLAWREMPEDPVWYGAAIVIASGLYVLWREHVRVRAAALSPAGRSA